MIGRLLDRVLSTKHLGWKMLAAGSVDVLLGVALISHRVKQWADAIDAAAGQED